MRNERIIFLDIDGVLTSINETPGSYLNHSNSEYGISPNCFKRISQLCSACDAKVIVSSNWRRFPDNGVWTNYRGSFSNRLPELRKMLGDRYLGDLPADRHLTKSEALKKWAYDNEINLREISFVIFDDDPREGYQYDEELSGHLVMTDGQIGVTEKDIDRAKEILKDE